MADQKITQLTALTTPALVDLVPIVDDPSGTPITKQITLSDLLTLLMSNVVITVLAGGASGTWTNTARAKSALVIAVGAGGAGGAITAVSEVGGGGGGGGAVIKLFASSAIAGVSYSVGGLATASVGSNTTFGTLTAGGGGIGLQSGNTTTIGAGAAPGAGGTATGGDLNIPGESGGRGIMLSASAGAGGYGGRSFMGTGAGSPANDAAGTTGRDYGGGGGGGHTSAGVDRAGGTGAAGVVCIIEFLA